MRSQDVIKRLLAEGWKRHHVKGSHQQFRHPGRAGKVTVPHPVRDLPADPIHKDRKSDYGITVPDLPGCFSAGSTMEEALTNAVEAIECHLEGMLRDGEEVPQPQPVETHRKNRHLTGGTWALVNIDLSRLNSKTKRINITVPERVLALVDEQARREGESRSGLLARAVMEYIGRHKPS